MAFELPPLPYDFNALEPYLDEETMRLHHGKHHAVYTNNVNKAIVGTEWEGKEISEILSSISSISSDIRGIVQNHGGGYANHCLFWEIMGPGKGGVPSGALAESINVAFGSFGEFKEKFQNAAATRFGSGWGWLVFAGDRTLKIYSTANQDSPYMQGDTPILGVDVWEHAYYKKYGPARADYLTNWWNIVNWDKVSSLYEQATKRK